VSAAVTKQNRSDVTNITYLEAVIQAQIEEMERDENVILMGEDIPVYGGGRIVDRFDASRVWSTPISEGSFTGVGIGAAIAGLRPIVDLGIASFMYLASDQIINQASKLRYMTGGQIRVSLLHVLRQCACGAAFGSAVPPVSQHTRPQAHQSDDGGRHEGAAEGSRAG